MASPIVLQSAVASLFVQVLIGIITGASFVIDISDATVRREVEVILGLEIGSQVIEFVWYVVVVCRFREIQTWARYLDWVLSTPVMLISTVLFFSHRDDSTSFVSPLRGVPLYLSLVCNWIMLLMGFLSETDRVPRPLGLTLGSLAFVASFTFLATHIPADDGLSIGLFWFMYVVWGGYGVAAILPYREKNVSYNFLDIVSKNFYGLFLFVYSLTRS